MIGRSLESTCRVLQAQRDGVERDVGHRSAALESMTKRANEQAAKLSTAEARVGLLEQGAAASDAELARLRGELGNSEQAMASVRQQLDALERAHLTEQGQSKVLASQLLCVPLPQPGTRHLYVLSGAADLSCRLQPSSPVG